jgi:hypothetical protein
VTTPDCAADKLGLTDTQQAALTGFSTRGVKALAHLREAWRIADRTNCEVVEASIRALLQSPIMQEQRDICATVLRAGLHTDQGPELLRAVGL